MGLLNATRTAHESTQGILGQAYTQNLSQCTELAGCMVSCFVDCVKFGLFDVSLMMRLMAWDDCSSELHALISSAVL